MATPQPFVGKLKLPVIASPLFIISGPELVIAQCKAGIIGSFPALNARPASLLDDWLHRIREELAAHDRDNPDSPAAPFAVNQVVHKSNPRWEADMEVIVAHKVPMVITSLGAREDVNTAVHSYGGLTFHDVTNDWFARKAVAKGADGLIAVAAGAGGHAGAHSPFALMQEIRSWWDGPLALAGAMSHGRSIFGAEAMGADFAYIGSAFIAASEANAVQGYKDMVVASSAKDIVYSDLFTGMHGNYLRDSITRAGLDPDHLDQYEKQMLDLEEKRPKAWKDIWGAGEGVGAVTAIRPVAETVAEWRAQYDAARAAAIAGHPALR